MSVPIRLAAFFVFSFMACGLSAHAQESTSRGLSSCLRPADEDAHSEDVYHPASFIEVSEVTRDRDVRELVRRELGVASQHEVDRRSMIAISFDRAWIARHPEFEAKIEITGSRNGTNIEVPAYSMVGEEQKVAVAGIRAGEEVISLLCELNAQGSLVPDVARQIDDWQTAITGYRTSVDQAAQQRRQTQQVLDAIGDDLRTLRADSQTASRSLANATAQDSVGLRLRADSINTLIRDLVRLQGSIQGETGAEAIAKFSARILPGLLSELRLLSTALAPLADTANLALLTSIGSRVGRQATVLQQVAQNIRGPWLRELERSDSTALTPDGITLKMEAAHNIVSGLEELRKAGQQYLALMEADARVLSQDLAQSLKDTQLLLAENNAEAGDRFVIRFVNMGADPTMMREYELDLRVDEFGLVRRVSDSFMFFARHGVNADTARLGQARTRVATTGRTEVVELPVDVTYEPAAGVTLGWTYNARRKSRGYAPFGWLRPGLGLNVSFPKFQTKAVTISRPDPDNPAALDENTEIESNNLDLGVGLVLTLFDNSVFVSAGRNLSADHAQWYHAVGFSFVNLAQKVVQAVDKVSDGT